MFKKIGNILKFCEQYFVKKDEFEENVNTIFNNSHDATKKDKSELDDEYLELQNYLCN